VTHVIIVGCCRLCGHPYYYIDGLLLLHFLFADINECDTLGSPEVCHECVNTYGSYSCFCRDGHMLQDDGISCEGIRASTSFISQSCMHACILKDIVNQRPNNNMWQDLSEAVI
jgi:hypothetical protein